MSKRKISILILILSLALFIFLLVNYISDVIKSRPVVISEREQYQKELLMEEQEEANK